MQDLATADLSIANDHMDSEAINTAIDDGAADNEATIQS